MKTSQLFLLAAFTAAFLPAKAQTEIPAGYTKGSIVLTDSSVVSGYFKEKIRGNASLTLLDGNKKKKNYDGSDLLAAEIGNEKFLCIRGDFFRILSDGELSFLQKSSDASRKPAYNGTETIFISGTEGDRDDYFIYDKKKKQLSLVTKKNFDRVVEGTFAGSTAAIDRAKAVHGEPGQLKEAVDIYNNRNSN